jgi:hypothetical protein
MVIKNRRY